MAAVDQPNADVDSGGGNVPRPVVDQPNELAPCALASLPSPVVDQSKELAPMAVKRSVPMPAVDQPKELAAMLRSLGFAGPISSSGDADGPALGPTTALVMAGT